MKLHVTTIEGAKKVRNSNCGKTYTEDFEWKVEVATTKLPGTWAWDKHPGDVDAIKAGIIQVNLDLGFHTGERLSELCLDAAERIVSEKMGKQLYALRASLWPAGSKDRKFATAKIVGMPKYATNDDIGIAGQLIGTLFAPDLLAGHALHLDDTLLRSAGLLPEPPAED